MALYTAMNPKTHKKIKIKKLPVFKVGEEFQERVDYLLNIDNMVLQAGGFYCAKMAHEFYEEYAKQVDEKNG